MTGRSGSPLEVEVPIGTRVFDAETKNLLADLTADGERWIAAEGGSGGLGKHALQVVDEPHAAQRTPASPARSARSISS
jgi:GTP-binding protein